MENGLQHERIQFRTWGFGVRSRDSGTYKAYVSALVAFRAGLLLYWTGLCVRGVDADQRPFQPHRTACGQLGNGFPLRFADGTVSFRASGLGISAQWRIAVGLSVDDVLHGHLRYLPDHVAGRRRISRCV